MIRRDVIVKGLDAEPIPCSEQDIFFPVLQDKGPHAVESF